MMRHFKQVVYHLIKKLYEKTMPCHYLETLTATIGKNVFLEYSIETKPL